MDPSFQEDLDEFDALCDVCGEALKELLIALLRDQRERHGVVGLRWVQFAPYYSDGEPCELDYQPSARLLREGDDSGSGPHPYEPASEEVRRVDEILGNVHREVLRRLFGNHAEVTLRGSEFSVSPHTQHD